MLEMIRNSGVTVACSCVHPPEEDHWHGKWLFLGSVLGFLSYLEKPCVPFVWVHGRFVERMIFLDLCKPNGVPRKATL